MNNEICIMEGCEYKEPYFVRCIRCGSVNYESLSWLGRVGKRAKKDKITREEAHDLMVKEYQEDEYYDEIRQLNRAIYG